MDIIKVHKSRLAGQVVVSGAKNSALRLLAASILSSEPIELSNFPNSLLDAKIHIDMLKILGKSIHSINNQIKIEEPDGTLSTNLEWQERSIRNTLLVFFDGTSNTTCIFHFLNSLPITSSIHPL